MLKALGVPSWVSPGASGGELLVEVGGRLCYKSFEVGLNANVTKIREGNHDYIGNILKQKHGSVLEHASATFVLLNVSRILTHELVRHRAGVALSQESMRFVRLDNIPIQIPDLRKEWEALKAYHADSAAAELINYAEYLQESFTRDITAVSTLAEKLIKGYSELLDKEGVPFSLKKKITSALRRMAPSGHATNIMVTANHRAWRHMIEQRTAEGAEQEIREVFLEIMEQLHKSFPAFYQDSKQLKDGAIQFTNSKI